MKALYLLCSNKVGSRPVSNTVKGRLSRSGMKRRSSLASTLAFCPWDWGSNCVKSKSIVYFLLSLGSCLKLGIRSEYLIPIVLQSEN